MDAALERERRLRSPGAPPPEPVSPLRAFLNSSMFYMPLAGLVAGLLAWMIFEPWFADYEMVGGEVVLVNREPIEVSDLFGGPAGFEDAVNITVGDTEVMAIPGQTDLEPGVDGRPAFESIDEIEAGMFIEASGEAFISRQIFAAGIRPATPEQARATNEAGEKSAGWAEFLLFPGTAVLIAFFLLLAEGIASRNWLRTISRRRSRAR